MQATVTPSDTLLVVDAMTGQEAANLVKAFDDEVSISGVGCGVGHMGLPPGRGFLCKETLISSL